MTIAVALGTAMSASAQVAEGQVEALGFVGGVTDGGGATFGGGLQYGFSPRLLAAVEAGYLTGSSEFSGNGVDVDSHAVSVDANVHYLFPSTSNPKLTPYVLGGIGFLRVSGSVSGGGFNVGGSDSTTGLNLGGGLRYQGGSNWGIRPEVKVLIADGSNVRFSVGFYRSF